ncbi:MAG: ABC transporter substrate-binding protein [Desulfobacterales bacterium]
MTKKRMFVFAPVVLVVCALLLPATTAFSEGKYKEAPMLTKLVEQGKLPPVAERLPENPLVVTPVERVGKYGGTWRSGMRTIADLGLVNREATHHDGLVRWKVDMSGWKPNLAHQIDINTDATEYTFHLRKGVKWSDGMPFTADDVMFWAEDLVGNKEYGLKYAPSDRFKAGGETFKAQKIDDYTVKLTFAKGYGLFLLNMCTGEANGEPIRYPKHVLKKYHPRYNKTNLDQLIAEAGVSSWPELMGIKGGYFNSHGSTADPRYDPEFPVILPYKIKVGPKQTTTALLYERNPYYWKVDTEGNQLPYIDYQEYTLYNDADAIALAAANGQIDFEWRHLFAPKYRPLIVENQKKGDYRIIPTKFTYANDVAIKLNLNHKDPVKREVFQNKKFRIGLSHAIDRMAIINTIYAGVGEPANISPLPDSGLYRESMAKQYTEYNVDLANKFLDEAGYSKRDSRGIRLGPDGKPIRIAFEVIGIYVDVGELVANNWKAVGIDVHFSEIERSHHATQIFANEHDIVLWSGDGGTRGDLYLNPRIYLPTSPFESEHATRWALWNQNPDAPEAMEPPADVKKQFELYDQFKAAATEKEQVRLMTEILKISEEQFHVMGILFPPLTITIAKNNFRNVPETLINSWAYPSDSPVGVEQFFFDQ